METIFIQSIYMEEYKTKSGRLSKRPTRYEPIEKVEDDYSDDDDFCSDDDSIDLMETDDESEDDSDEDADENGNLKGFVVDESESEDDEENA
jgi:hypothetical protein